METLYFDDDTKLIEHIFGLGPRRIYRGQCSHYATPDDVPSLRTSMGRLGCVPQVMGRWLFYAQEVLRTSGIDVPSNQSGLDLLQALLQHYGWRSFYVDFSASFFVAAWFASHKYKSTTPMSLCVDCFGNDLLLFREEAKYELNDDLGHVYVLDLGLASLRGIKVFPLDSLEVRGRCRFREQEARLVGPVKNSIGGLLDPSIVVQHIKAPAAVLAKCASRSRLMRTQDLFPTSEEDPILMALKAVPWVRIVSDDDKDDSSLNAFQRGLRIPEYDYVFRKDQPATMSFTSPTSLSQRRPRRKSDDNILREAMFIKLSESAYFSKASAEWLPMPRLKGLLETHKCIVVETDAFIKIPEELKTAACTKGVILDERENGRVYVHELIVDHPGMEIAGVGSNMGLTYRWQGARLERESTVEDCTCNNSPRHNRHVAVLENVEWALEHLRPIKTGKLTIRFDE